ncbi:MULTISPECIES: histidine kinase [unclassified Microbacterium]|uniref:sensor histidine kinase n=1 Tax=unclassified Microbacterium TaxID=2609290 RepID=UPI0036493894
MSTDPTVPRRRPETVAQSLMSAPWRLLLSPWPWRALLFLLASAVLGLLLLVLLPLTLLLLPLWGILCGMLERRRLPLLGFARIPSGHVRVAPDQRHNWLNIRLTEPATWREAAVLLVDLVAGVAALIVLFFEAMALIVVVGVPIVALVRGDLDIRLFGDARIQLDGATWWLPPLALLVVLIAAAYLNLLLATAQGFAVRWLLAPRGAEIAQRIERLTRSRAAVVTAHEDERRRIERDLHDGVQQELVLLAGRLGMLELELAALGPEAEPGRVALTAAQDQVERASASLRESVRGIHPAVLTDRGLGAALEELAGRAPLRVVLRLDRLGRAAPSVEAAAYAVVREALTNVVKHTDATHVLVVAHTDPELLEIRVRDDGRGEADPARGTGLSGLVARAAALDGDLVIASPPGGPTTLVLTMPRGLGGGSEDDSGRPEEVPDANPLR